MAEKKKRADLLFEPTDVDSTESDVRDIDTGMSGKAEARKLSPMGMRVVVGIRKDANVTDGGLYLPEGAKQNMQESLLAEVLEVASAVDHSTQEETNVSGIPLGALVLIPKQAGVKVPWNEDLRIIDVKDVLAIVHEISVV